jgi:hypothetical protein
MKTIRFFIFLIFVFSMIGMANAELNKSDLEEIRRIVREEIRHVDKRVDEVKGDLRDIRSEINNLRVELRGFMLWGFGIVFAGIFALIGFVLWDRRTALAPAIRKNQELEERELRLEKALREYARREPKLAEILRSVGIL